LNISFINTIRAVAIIAVVAIHVSAPALSGPMNANWWTGNIIDSLSRIGVPLFLMISGALLLHKDEPIGTFFKKRIAKILIPFLFWSTFYYLYKINSGVDMHSFPKALLGNEMMYHLWYFYIIIPLYLLIPLLRKVVKQIPVNYILAYAIIASSIVTLNGLLGLFEAKLAIYANPFSGGVAYLLLGYAITHQNVKIKFINLYTIISAFVIIFGTYLLTFFTGRFNGTLYEALGLPVTIYAVAVFMFIKQKQKDSTSNTRLISLISTYSFGIYLVHPYILNTLNDYMGKFSLISGGGIISHIIIFTGTLFISLLVVLLLSKIKWVRKIV